MICFYLFTGRGQVECPEAVLVVVVIPGQGHWRVLCRNLKMASTLRLAHCKITQITDDILLPAATKLWPR